MNLRLVRLKQDDSCTLGELYAHDGERICVTLEEPWRDNAKDVSCIPAGKYEWFKRLSPKRGVEVIELKNVPNRGNIQIHVGNVLTDTEGCILVGSARGVGAGISGSRLAFQKLMTEVKDVQEGTIEVIDVAPPLAA